MKRVTGRLFVKGAAGGAAAVAGAGASSCIPEEKIVKPWLPDKWDYEADVVVVGYGGAGACAAIAAYDAGVTPLVLEKAPFANGGNTGCCYGGNIVVYYSTEDAIDYLRAMCWGTVTDEELIHTFVLTMNDLPGWLESLGMRLYYKKGFNVSYSSRIYCLCGRTRAPH